MSGIPDVFPDSKLILAFYSFSLACLTFCSPISFFSVLSLGFFKSNESGYLEIKDLVMGLKKGGKDERGSSKGS